MDAARVIFSVMTQQKDLRGVNFQLVKLVAIGYRIHFGFDVNNLDRGLCP